MTDETSAEEIIKQGVLFRWTHKFSAFKTAPNMVKANKHALKKMKKQERSSKPDKKDRWQPRVFTLTKNRLVYESKKEIDKKHKKAQDKEEIHYIDEPPPQHDVVSKRKTHAWWRPQTKEEKRTCFFDPMTAQVTEVQSIKEMDDARTNRFFFQITQGQKGVHILQARTMLERQEWVDAINWVLGFHCKGQQFMSESSDEDDVPALSPGYASLTTGGPHTRPRSPRARAASTARQTESDWEDQLPRWALPHESDGNPEEDEDLLARELAKEFIQRLQNSNMSLHAPSPNDKTPRSTGNLPKNGRKKFSLDLPAKSPDQSDITWQYRSSNNIWEDYKKRDAQKMSHYYTERTAVVDLGKWVVDFGKMTAHSKGKSPCRAVRGVHANGKMADAMLSPNDSHVGSSTVHKRGLLYRKTDMKGKYVSRLFTLTDGALQYSHGKASSKKTQRQLENKKHGSAWKRSMNLQRVYAVTTTVQTLSHGDSDGRYFFEVQQPDRCMTLYATSAADRTDWLTAIAAVVDANCRRVGYTMASDSGISPTKLFTRADHDVISTQNSSEEDDPTGASGDYAAF